MKKTNKKKRMNKKTTNRNIRQHKCCGSGYDHYLFDRLPNAAAEAAFWQTYDAYVPISDHHKRGGSHHFQMAFAAFVSVINEQTLGTADAEVVRLDDLMTTLSKLRSTAHRDDSDADSGYVEQTPANDVLDTAMARIQELIDERRSNLGVVAPQVESAAEERHLHELATV